MENHHFQWVNPHKSTISMVIFNSYVKLPEGTPLKNQLTGPNSFSTGDPGLNASIHAELASCAKCRLGITGQTGMISGKLFRWYIYIYIYLIYKIFILKIRSYIYILSFIYIFRQIIYIYIHMYKIHDLYDEWLIFNRTIIYPLVI